MKTLLRILLVTLALPCAVGSAQEKLPPGKWWKQPAVVERLGLSSKQQLDLDAIFRQHANQLIDQRAEVEKRSIELHGELDQPQLSRERVLKAAARVSEARSLLFERELMMLVDMRGVLTAEQWERFRITLQRRERMMQHQPQRPAGRPTRPNRRKN